MSLPYGFMSASEGHIIVDPEKANIIRTIYQQHLSGMSPGGIAGFLFEHNVLSQRKRPLDTANTQQYRRGDQPTKGYPILFQSIRMVACKLNCIKQNLLDSC